MENIVFNGTVKTAKKIINDGKIVSAVNAFSLPADDLVKSNRNAAGDPSDYFDYVMFAWSNVNSGYRLAMERYLERSPSEEELNEKFIPGISFHFRYDDVIKYKGYIFDGYHPAKIKDGFNLEELLYLCVIPQSLKS